MNLVREVEIVFRGVPLRVRGLYEPEDEDVPSFLLLEALVGEVNVSLLFNDLDDRELETLALKALEEGR
jgi:hypothetical protein